MKTLQLLCFLLLTSMLTAQQTIRIDFAAGAPGDYDLMLQENLERSGYRTFINYGERAEASDFILKYELKNLKKGSATRHLLELTLTDAKGNVLKNKSAKVNADNRPNAAICRGLEDLFGYRFNCTDCRQFPKVSSFNIDFTVSKIDSAAYMIVGFGAAARKHAGVKKGVLRKANQYLDGFSYFCMEGEYRYAVSGFVHNAPAVIGFVYGHETPGVQEEMEELPLTIDLELELTMGGDGK